MTISTNCKTVFVGGQPSYLSAVALVARQHTGISFVEWRQQACLLAAVVRLGQGEAVTRVASYLGYSSPSAFSGVFRKVLGETPSRYFARARA